jgi:hypothetical protein
MLAFTEPRALASDMPASALAPNLQQLTLEQMRAAIRSNQVSFPSQVPTFARHDRPDLQRKLVQLYFVLGWSCGTIGARYGLIRQRVQQILNIWKRRAIEMGYIQTIPGAEELEKLAAVPSIHRMPLFDPQAVRAFRPVEPNNRATQSLTVRSNGFLAT